MLKINGQNVQCLNLNHYEGLIEDIIKEKLSNENFDFIIIGGLSSIIQISNIVWKLFVDMPTKQKLSWAGG